VKMRLGNYRVNVLLKRTVFDPNLLTVDLYRVVFLPKLKTAELILRESLRNMQVFNPITKMIT
jgi:hypothetical protein